MVLKKELVPIKVSLEDDEEPCGTIIDEGSLKYSKERKRGRTKNKLDQSLNTLPTDSDSSYSAASPVPSSAYSSASTSAVDSWE